MTIRSVHCDQNPPATTDHRRRGRCHVQGRSGPGWKGRPGRRPGTDDRGPRGGRRGPRSAAAGARAAPLLRETAPGEGCRRSVGPYGGPVGAGFLVTPSDRWESSGGPVAARWERRFPPTFPCLHCTPSSASWGMYRVVRNWFDISGTVGFRRRMRGDARRGTGCRWSRSAIRGRSVGRPVADPGRPVPSVPGSDRPFTSVATGPLSPADRSQRRCEVPRRTRAGASHRIGGLLWHSTRGPAAAHIPRSGAGSTSLAER